MKYIIDEEKLKEWLVCNFRSFSSINTDTWANDFLKSKNKVELLAEGKVCGNWDGVSIGGKDIVSVLSPAYINQNIKIYIEVIK